MSGVRIAVDSVLAGVSGVMFITTAVAASGRFHSKVPLVRYFFIIASIASLLRAIKFSVPNLASFKPGTAPDVGTSDWWWLFGEFLIYWLGNVCVAICYAIILRMWHNALKIINGSVPGWFQMVLLYGIALCLVSDVILTVMLGFIVPDVINVLDAFKDAALSLTLVGGFIAYWVLLRNALQFIAELANASAIMEGGSRDLASVVERATSKLRRISFVSALCTIGILYRAGSLINFALVLVHFVSEPLRSSTSIALERFFFYAAGELLPFTAMLIIMAKSGRCSRACLNVLCCASLCRRCCGCCSGAVGPDGTGVEARKGDAGDAEGNDEEAGAGAGEGGGSQGGGGKSINDPQSPPPLSTNLHKMSLKSSPSGMMGGTMRVPVGYAVEGGGYGILTRSTGPYR